MLNVHFHTLALDGVYVRADDGTLDFHPLPPPTAEEVAEVARRTAERVRRSLEQRGRELCERHGGLEIQLDADSRYLDLSKREADVAVRAVARDATPPPHLLGRKLVPIVIASYVARAHADRLDPEREGTDARWLGSDQARIVEAIVASSSYPDLPIWGAFASMTVLIEAARAGLGLAVMPTYVGDPDPTLRRLARPDVRHMGDFWLLSHPDLRDNARLRAAREHVAAALTSRAGLFAGDGPVGGWSAAAPERPEDAPCDDGASFVDLPGGQPPSPEGEPHR